MSTTSTAKPIRILLIEDDITLSEMYQFRFREEGMDVTPATDGQSGLDLAKQQKFDLILLDVIMPKLDGFTILQTLKSDAKLKKTPVLLLTNLGQESDRQKGIELGAVDYIVKAEMTPTEIMEKIRTYVTK